MRKNSDSYLRFLSFYIILRLGWLDDKQKEHFCLIFADLPLPISLASLDISEVWHGALLTVHPTQSSVLHRPLDAKMQSLQWPLVHNDQSLHSGPPERCSHHPQSMCCLSWKLPEDSGDKGHAALRPLQHLEYHSSTRGPLETHLE